MGTSLHRRPRVRFQPVRKQLTILFPSYPKERCIALDTIAFYAHPNDKTMPRGGSLTLSARLGAWVCLSISMRGEGNEMDELLLRRRSRPGVG
jgi:hypothetical protein